MQDIKSKWGEKVAERGFTQIPNYLLQINTYVHDDHQLTPTEMIVLLQLISSWWKKNEMPYPSMKTLAEKICVSERQIQRSVNSLEEKGYIKKDKKKVKGIIATNIYDLTPLIEHLNTIADHFVNKHPRRIKEPTEKQSTESKK